MATGEMYRKVLTAHRERYIPTCKESIVTNGHMNDYKGEAFDSALVMNAFLEEIIDKFCREYKGGPASGAVVDGLISAAREYYRNRMNIQGLPYQPDTVKAVMVDYINYCAAQGGMDLGLYASDI